MEFGTITVSATASRMGHEGMRASLVSREVICDSVETVVYAERLDGFVGLAGCDKSIPAMLMAAARLDLPSVFVYNGSIMPGEHNGTSLDITSVFEAVGACAAGHDHRGGARRDRAQGVPRRGRVRRHVHRQHDELDRRGDRDEPARHGVAAGRSTAAATATPRRAGEAVVEHARASASRRGMIMTKQAFENAIAVTSALGGSTNAVLHLLAIANEAGVELELDDFNRIAAKVPAHRRHEAGRQVPHERPRPRRRRARSCCEHLLDAGLLHGDVLTVTGKTMAENLAELDPPRARRRRRPPARRSRSTPRAASTS